MSYFAVLREAGPAWDNEKGAFGQPAVNEHAAYMDALADQGLILFAGPLAGSEHGRIRVLLIADADNETTIRARLAGDPWQRANRVVPLSVERWNLFVGAQRLAAAPQIQG
jgi:uncharacterized protein YciI